MNKKILQKPFLWNSRQTQGNQTLQFQKFVNCLMKDGKKQKAFSLASQSLRGAYEKLEKQQPVQSGIHLSIMHLLSNAIENVRPSVEVRSKKIAGISREIPCLVPLSRGQGLAIRWIIESARGRKKTGGRSFSDHLAEEILDAYLKKGNPRQKREYLHKTAATNRAFLRYRWW